MEVLFVLPIVRRIVVYSIISNQQSCNQGNLGSPTQ